MDNYEYHASAVGIKDNHTTIDERLSARVPLEEAKAWLIEAIKNVDEGTTLVLTLRAYKPVTWRSKTLRRLMSAWRDPES